MAKLNGKDAAADATSDDDLDSFLAEWEPHTVDVTITLHRGTDQERSMVFRFAAIGREKWHKLIGEHPATEEQQTEARQRALDNGALASQLGRLPWNPDTFPPAAIAASCVTPKLTIQQARTMWNDPRRNDGELDRLFSAARLANESPGSVRLGKDLETILASAGL